MTPLQAAAQLAATTDTLTTIFNASEHPGADPLEIEVSLTWPMDRGVAAMAYLWSLTDQEPTLAEMVSERLAQIDAAEARGVELEREMVITPVVSGLDGSTELELSITWPAGAGLAALQVAEELGENSKQISERLAGHLTHTWDASWLTELVNMVREAGTTPADPRR